MEYSFKQQIPYIVLLTVLSWVHIYLFTPKNTLLNAIMVGPMIALSLWGCKKYATPRDSFSITGSIIRYSWLIVAYIIVNCISRYYETGSCSLWFGLSMAVMALLAAVIIDRSIYD
jgi:hypothetical protein